MKLRNISPLGHIDLPLVGRQGHPDNKIRAVERPDGSGLIDDVPLEGEERHGFGCLEPGEEFDVSAKHARILLDQVGNYEPADDASLAIAEKIADRKAKAAGHVVDDEDED